MYDMIPFIRMLDIISFPHYFDTTKLMETFCVCLWVCMQYVCKWFVIFVCIFMSKLGIFFLRWEEAIVSDFLFFYTMEPKLEGWKRKKKTRGSWPKATVTGPITISVGWIKINLLIVFNERNIRNNIMRSSRGRPFAMDTSLGITSAKHT